MSQQQSREKEKQVPNPPRIDEPLQGHDVVGRQHQAKDESKKRVDAVLHIDMRKQDTCSPDGHSGDKNLDLC